MDVTSTTSVPTTTSSDTVSNPKSQLTADDFMQLFLTELQYQDPTNPMDTDKMLEQTSQMTQLQSNTDLSNTLKKLTDQMNASNQFSSVSLIGKIADTGNDGFAVTDAKDLKTDIPFNLYFDNDYLSATVKITDSNGNTVRTFPLQEGKKGIQSFTWDGKDDAKNPVPDGIYRVSADFKNTNLQEETTKMGRYPISSIKFDSGEAYAKLGSNYVPLSSIKEVDE